MSGTWIVSRIGVAKMSIRPIFPVVVMVFVLLVFVAVTVTIISRNPLKLKDKILTIIRLGLIYALVFCIGLRPVTMDDEYEFSTKNLDVLFVVDTTISMWAGDYNGSKERMDGVIADAGFIIDELAGSNFALVTFDDQAHVLAPFTQDFQYIENLFETFSSPDSTMATGSDLSLPYKDIESLLLSSSRKENRKTIVFYISDGEITNGTKLSSYKDLAQYVDGGAVFGYGTEAGGKMKDGSWGYIYDYDTHQDAISKIDEANLKQVAEDLGINYYNVNDGNAAIKGEIELIKQSSKTIVEKGMGAEAFQDTYFYFAIALALVLLWELFVIVRKGRL